MLVGWQEGQLSHKNLLRLPHRFSSEPVEKETAGNNNQVEKQRNKIIYPFTPDDRWN